eukprot:126045-Rhodomonas_salina.1
MCSSSQRVTSRLWIKSLPSRSSPRPSSARIVKSKCSGVSLEGPCAAAEAWPAVEGARMKELSAEGDAPWMMGRSWVGGQRAKTSGRTPGCWSSEASAESRETSPVGEPERDPCQLDGESAESASGTGGRV